MGGQRVGLYLATEGLKDIVAPQPDCCAMDLALRSEHLLRFDQFSKCPCAEAGLKPIADCYAASFAKPPRQRRIACQALNSVRHCAGVMRWHKETVHVRGNEFRHAARISADHGSLASHSLHVGDSKRLTIARQNKDMRLVKPRGNHVFVHRSKQCRSFVQSQRSDLSLHCAPEAAAAVIVLASDGQPCVNSAIAQQSCRAQRDQMSLRRVQPSTGEQVKRLSGGPGGVWRTPAKALDVHAHGLHAEVIWRSRAERPPRRLKQRPGDNRTEFGARPLKLLVTSKGCQRIMQCKAIRRAINQSCQRRNKSGTAARADMQMFNAVFSAKPGKLHAKRNKKGPFKRKPYRYRLRATPKCA